jgi:hypothetical protein
MSTFGDLDFPHELSDRLAEDMQPKDGAQAHVYARVELTGPRAMGSKNPWAHARPAEEWARELVTSIVEAATFNTGGSRWTLLSGALLYHGTIAHDGDILSSWSGSPSFVDPSVLDENRRFMPPIKEGTGEALESLDHRFAERLAAQESSAVDAVAEVRWYEAARHRSDAAQRIALHVRAFERALPLAGNERWNDAVKRYFREFWALDVFDSILFNLATSSDFALRTHGIELAGIEEWVIHDGDRFSVALGTVLREAQQIERLLPAEFRLERRAARRAARWAANPTAVRDHISLLEQHFDILLNRALRQRNAVIHGVKTVPDVLASVDSFVARLAAYIVAQAVLGAGAGDELVEALERGRQSSRQVIWRLSQGHTPVEQVLYGPEDAD